MRNVCCRLSVVLGLLLGLCVAGHAEEIRVRKGDDLGKALGRARHGDKVVLSRGCVYEAVNLTVPAGVTLKAGKGKKDLPIVTGAIPIEKWEDGKRNRYTAEVEAPLACYDSQGWLIPARYPNEGWLRTESGTTGSRIVSSGLKKSKVKSWAGSQLRWRRWSWYYEVRKISGDDGKGNLSLAKREFKAPDHVGIGSGFYLEGMPALDEEREYWHDGKTLTLISKEKGGPKKGEVWVIRKNSGLTLGPGAEIDRICLRGYGEKALSLNQKATVRRCRFDYIYNSGLGASWNAAGSVVEENEFNEILTNAIYWNENPGGPGGTEIRGNTFTNIGSHAGWGVSGTWKCCGIIVSNANKDISKSVRIYHNRFDRIGYAGVILGADNQRVEQNLFRRCMLTHNDGAAIYTNSHGNLIKENVVLETVGDLSSSQPWYPLGHGIWPEFLEEFRDHRIIGNTVYGSGGNGLFLPNNRTATISDNVFVSNRLGGIGLGGSEKSKGAQNHTITGNVFAIGGHPYEKPEGETLAQWNHLNDHNCLVRYNPGINFGTMKDNHYFIPKGGFPVIWSDKKEVPLDQWKKQSWADAGAEVKEAKVMLLINDSDKKVSMKAPKGSWKTIDGEKVKKTVSVEPWRSAVLVGKKMSKSLPGYILYSEMDD